ncbi:cyclin-dependent kinase inhibitor 7 [Capsicum chacoense]
MMECKRIGEATIKEVSDENDMVVPATTQKSMISDGDVKLSPADSVHLKENSASNEPAGITMSCCSKFLDLDEKYVEVADNEAESSKMEPPEMPENEKSPPLTSPEMPEIVNSPPRLFPEVEPTDEIEEFLATFEREMLRRFRQKYNFDFEKEEPLEGRYEWVQLQTYGN